MPSQYTLPPLGQTMYDALKRRPFEPFWIVTRTGAKYLVHRLLQAGLNQTTVLYQPDGRLLIRMQLDDIAEICPAPQSARAG